MAHARKARAVGFNHVALEVGDIDEALAFYGRLFEFELRSRSKTSAFIDLGDQFLALQKGRTQPADDGRHFGLVVDDKEAVRRALAEAGVETLPGQFLDFLGQSATTTSSSLRRLAWPGVVAVPKNEKAMNELSGEGRTVAIQYRWADGRTERFGEIVTEFVRLKVDVIVTGGNAAVAAKQASSVVPIVFALASDPVGDGLVASLARPGGNITGLSLQAPDLASKRLALLREVVPGLRRLAIMVNVDLPAAALEIGEIQAAAGTLGLDVATFEIRRAEDIAPAFEALKGRAEALYVVADALVIIHRVRIHTLALTAQLPTMHGTREYVEAGGLMSYGPSFTDLFRRAGDYVDKILRGSKPGEIPVEQPTKFDLVINLTTARALGLTVPDTLLARADEVIE